MKKTADLTPRTTASDTGADPLALELATLRLENDRLRQRETELLGYLRAKIDALLKLMGTLPLRSDELDDEHLITFDPIGVITETFAHILENLQHTNEKLSLARDEITAIFDAAGAGILVLDREQMIVSCNSQLKEMFHFYDELVSGQCCLQRLCRAEAPPPECVFFKVMASQQLEKTMSWGYEGRYFDVVGAPIKGLDGAIARVVLVYQEVTARRRAEADLQLALIDTQTAHAQIDSIIHSVTEGLLVIDNDWRVQLANPATAAIFQSPPKTLIGRSLDELFPDLDIESRFWQARAAGEVPDPFDFDFPGDTAHSLRSFQVRSAQLRAANGSVRGMVLSLHDVTKERSLERMKSEFVSTAAHELRTPLAAILGFSELLLHAEDFSAAEQAEFIQLIHRKTEDLSAVIEDVLDVSRIEAGDELPLDAQPCSLALLITQSFALFRHTSPSHCFELVAPDAALLVLADKLRVSQILDNLLSNAVKYAPAGGAIRVRFTAEDGWCRVAVSDEGIGMTPEQVARIFDKFYRVNTRNTAVSGTGLGMTIVKDLVEAHGGRIWVESDLGRGTTVNFTLPLAPVSGFPVAP